MTVADDCAELAFLAGRLDEALLRDNTHIGRGSPCQPLSLYNTDVLQAKIILAAEIPAAAMRCCDLIHEPWPEDGRPWDACLDGIPRWHDRLHVLHLATGRRTREDGTVIACCHLDSLARSWLRITKQALGLQTRPHPLRFRCPYCETGTLLMDVAAVASVNPRDLTAPPKWERRGSHVYCPDCLADWPEPNWGQLMLLLEQAAREQAST